jgi:hypothetical protein
VHLSHTPKRIVAGIALGTVFGVISVLAAGILFLVVRRRNVATHRRTFSGDDTRALTGEVARLPRTVRFGPLLRLSHPLPPLPTFQRISGLTDDADTLVNSPPTRQRGFSGRTSAADSGGPDEPLLPPPPMVMRQSGFNASFISSETSWPLARED